MEPLALAALVLLTGMARAQNTAPQLEDWTFWRDGMLNQEKELLLQTCEAGRQENRRGRSFWEGSGGWRTSMQQELGLTPRQLEAFETGMSAAMVRACPDVRQR